MSIEDKIKYTFKNKKLLAEALTHKSFSAERGSRHNERLEFLGDSVVGLVASEYLFHEYPTKDEGFLSKLKATLVSRANLTRCAKELKLGEYLSLGVGERQSGGKQRDSILTNSFEAVVGAVYLDGGLAAAKTVILTVIKTPENTGEESDYKSALQEVMQKSLKQVPVYNTLSEEGPEHNKIFTISVSVGKKVLGIGAGKNKKEAQQAAAKNALDYLENHEVKPDEL